jgi:hypothetical protein
MMIAPTGGKLMRCFSATSLMFGMERCTAMSWLPTWPLAYHLLHLSGQFVARDDLSQPPLGFLGRE